MPKTVRAPRKAKKARAPRKAKKERVPSKEKAPKELMMQLSKFNLLLLK